MATNDIGRRDSVDKVKTTSMNATGVVQLLPTDPLGRRNFIRVKNVGATTVAVVTSSTMPAASGYTIPANGGEWEDTTNAPLYVVSTGANSAILVYERAAMRVKDQGYN